MTPTSVPSTCCPCVTLLRQETEGPSTAGAQCNLQSREEVVKEFGKSKNSEISPPILMRQSQRLSPGFGKTKSCSFPHESAQDLIWFLSQSVTPGILHDSQFPHLCSCLQAFESCKISPSTVIPGRVDTSTVPSPRVKLLSL